MSTGSGTGSGSVLNPVAKCNWLPIAVIGGIVAYLVVSGFFAWLLFKGSNETKEAALDVGEQVTEMNGGIQGVQQSLNALPKSLGEIINAGYTAQRAREEKERKECEEERKKQEAARKASTPAPTSVTPISTTPVLPADDIPSLIQQLGEDEECVWKQAGEQLQKHGLAAIPQLVKTLELPDPVRFRAKWCLIHIGPASLNELVNIGFASKNPEAREAAISAVVTIGGYNAREKLNKASWNLERPLVRHTANEAINRFDAKESERPRAPTQRQLVPPREDTKSRP